LEDDLCFRSEREFVYSLSALIGGAAAVWLLAARAQEPGSIYRFGDLDLRPRNASRNVALFDAVRTDNFIDGQNLTIGAAGFGLRRSSGRTCRRHIVKAQVDVIRPPAIQPSANEATPILAIIGGSGRVWLAIN